MMMRVFFPKWVRLLCAACLLPLAAHGLEFRVLSWSGTVKDLRLSTGKGSPLVPLQASEDALSPSYQARGGEPLKLFGPQSAEAPLATLPLPEGLTRAILVLVPKPGEGDAYAGHWLDDSPEARPDNSITLHNLSSAPVALQIGPTQRRLEPGGSHVQNFTDSSRAVMLQIAVPRGEGWERIVSSPQPVRRGFRILIILRDGRRQADGSRAALDRVTFYDYRRPAKMP